MAQTPAAIRLIGRGVARQPSLGEPRRGMVIFPHRTDDPRARRRCRGPSAKGSFAVSHNWPNRLVRAEVDLTRGRIRFYKLRRRDPANHPLLNEVRYEPPRKRFQG